MGSILSQEEVSALLKGVSSGSIETETHKEDEAAGTLPYDFISQDRIIRGRMPTLEIINERFSRELTNALSITLGKNVDVTVASSKTVKFGEFMKSISVPSSLNVLKMGNLRGHILLVLDPNLVFMLVDMFFGGSGQTHVKVEEREFTFIEQRIIKKVVDMSTIEMEKAWKPVVPLNFAHMRSEVNLQFATIVQPGEIVIVTKFNVEAENFTGSMSLCFPYSTIEPVKEKLYASFQTEELEIDRGWVARLKELLGATNLRMNAELGRTELKLKDLSNLKNGDVILLDTGIEDELKLGVEGVTKFMGRAGIYNGKPSIKITRVLDRGEKNA